MKRSTFFIAVLFVATSVLGQESSKDKVTVSGFTDIYYSWNFNDPGALGNRGISGAGRVFDGIHNQIAFNMIQTKFTYESDRLEVVGDLLFGPGAEIANFGNVPLGSAVVIKQAYLAYELHDKWTFSIGQFSTHIGYELVDAPDNFHYSSSYLFGNGPFYHTGAKLDYAMSDKIGFMAGILNGWDNLIDNNEDKSVALQVSLTPNEDVGIYLNWIGGPEDATAFATDADGVRLNSYKHMVDLTASFAVSETFNVGVNGAFGSYDFDTRDTENWGGAALYMDYRFTDDFALGWRVEIFDDESDVQNFKAAYVGYTLTGVFSMADDHYFVKPEVRYDSSNKDAYWDGKSGTKLTNSQFTAGISFIAKF